MKGGERCTTDSATQIEEGHRMWSSRWKLSFVNSLAGYTLLLSLFPLIACFQPVPDNYVDDYTNVQMHSLPI